MLSEWGKALSRPQDFKRSSRSSFSSLSQCSRSFAIRLTSLLSCLIPLHGKGQNQQGQRCCWHCGRMGLPRNFSLQLHLRVEPQAAEKVGDFSKQVVSPRQVSVNGQEQGILRVIPEHLLPRRCFNVGKILGLGNPPLADTPELWLGLFQKQTVWQPAHISSWKGQGICHKLTLMAK